MATKVFLSWGGELSCKLAGALRDWLPAALQYVKPYFTPDDVEKGTKWNAEIAKELETSNIGIICLTRDNTERPWILFEAGALSKSVDKSRVCTLLFNLESTDLKGPLTSFQCTRFVKEDFQKLVSAINSLAGDAKLESAVMDSVFDMWWPRLERQIADILSTHAQRDEEPPRPDRDILEEILELTRASLSRSSRPPRIQRSDVTELIDGIMEFMMMFGPGHGELSHAMFRHLDRPLRHLCREAGMPELHERYRMLLEERLFRGDPVDAAKSGQSDERRKQIGSSGL
jgi:hypothetical protein